MKNMIVTQSSSQQTLWALAPMDGFTDCCYRAIAYEVRRQYGNHSQSQYKTRTEFMNVDGFLRVPQKLIHHLVSVSDYPSPIAQIYGGNRDTLVEACHVICQKYPQFDGIELNIGCPSPSVMSCEAGAGMMKDKNKTRETVKAMSDACAEYAMPFSIKTRLGLTLDDKNEQTDFITRSIPFCKYISVHARTFKQGHSGDVDRETLYRIKKEYGDRIKLIGNGGVSSYDDGLTKQENLDGIMIAQAAIGNPWIFTPHIPSAQDRYAIIMRHFQMFLGRELYMLEHRHYTDDIETYIFPMPSVDDLMTRGRTVIDTYDGKKLYTVLEFRKHCFSYLKTLPGSKECKVALAQLTDPQAIQTTIDTYFASIKGFESE